MAENTLGHWGCNPYKSGALNSNPTYNCFWAHVMSCYVFPSNLCLGSKVPKRFRCYNRHGFIVVHHETIQGMIWCPLEQQVLPDCGQLLKPPGMGP